jgi:hypothetical protein
MRSRTAGLAAMLAMEPIGVKGADLGMHSRTK